MDDKKRIEELENFINHNYKDHFHLLKKPEPRGSLDKAVNYRGVDVYLSLYEIQEAYRVLNNIESKPLNKRDL